MILLFLGIGEGVLGMLIKGYVRATTQSKLLDPEIKALKASMAGDQTKVTKLEQEKRSVSREEVKLSQLIPQEQAQEVAAQQQPANQAQSGGAPTEQQPWNAPADFNQNVVNDNAAASADTPISGNPGTAANDNGEPASEQRAA